MKRMLLQNKVCEKVSALLAGLKECSSSSDLIRGKIIHRQACESGADADLYVASSLINMYAKCGSLRDARAVFDKMKIKNVVSWNSLILGYAKEGQGDAALALLASMPDSRCKPNALTIVAALKACARLAEHEDSIEADGKLLKLQSLEKGRAVHSQAIELGCAADAMVANCLIEMYCKCGDLDDAREIFDRMGSNRSPVSWNTLILGCAENGQSETALELFNRMPDPDGRSFLAAIKACINLGEKEERKNIEGMFLKIESLRTGREIQSKAEKPWDCFVCNSLLDLYIKSGSLIDAQRIFNAMPCHSVVSCTVLMIGLAENGDGEGALEIFEAIKARCSPDGLAFIATIKACICIAAQEQPICIGSNLVKLRSLEKGMAIHAQARELDRDGDVFVASSLVDMYAKIGSMADSRRVFQRMKCPSVIAWTAIILGYAENGQEDEALDLLKNMQEQGCNPNALTFVAALKACCNLAEKEHGEQIAGIRVKVKLAALDSGMAVHSQASRFCCCESDLFLASSLIEMYAKCGSTVDARRVFDRISRPDLVLWTAMILGYIENGEAETGMQILQIMQQQRGSIVASAQTLIAALKACGSMVDLQLAKTVNAQILKNGLENASLAGSPIVGNALIDAYGKCGSMTTAQFVFDSAEKLDLVAWNALLSGYSREGGSASSDKIFNLFYEMLEQEQDLANEITFACVLAACSHAGLVDAGKSVFKKMSDRHGVKPNLDHYNCLIDLLARANRIDEAVEIAQSMPWKPDESTWMSVLGSCYKWKNVALGKIAFEALIDLGAKKNSAAYTVMANLYATAEMREKIEKDQSISFNP